MDELCLGEEKLQVAARTHEATAKELRKSEASHGAALDELRRSEKSRQITMTELQSVHSNHVEGQMEERIHGEMRRLGDVGSHLQGQIGWFKEELRVVAEKHGSMR